MLWEMYGTRRTDGERQEYERAAREEAMRTRKTLFRDSETKSYTALCPSGRHDVEYSTLDHSQLKDCGCRGD